MNPALLLVVAQIYLSIECGGVPPYCLALFPLSPPLRAEALR